MIIRLVVGRLFRHSKGKSSNFMTDRQNGVIGHWLRIIGSTNVVLYEIYLCKYMESVARD